MQRGGSGRDPLPPVKEFGSRTEKFLKFDQPLVGS